MGLLAAHFGAMKPIVVARLGDDSLSTSVSLEGGKNVHWNDTLLLTRSNADCATIMLDLVHLNSAGDDDLIGQGLLSLTPALVQDKRITRTVDLYFEGLVKHAFIFLLLK
jgi:hypothetical protein